MWRQTLKRAAALTTLTTLAAFVAALSGSPIAEAAGNQLRPLQITPSSGCGLLTAYTGGTGLPAWSGPTPSCGTGALTLAFNQGNTPPPAAFSSYGGVGTAGSALLSAWSARSVPDGARVGYLLTAPAGITINNVSVTAQHLQNIANGRGWIGLTYWNGGTAQVLPDGTAVDAAASGPLDTSYWGIELRCVEAECVWPGELELSSLTVYAAEAQGPSIVPVADPASLWDHAGGGELVWNAPGDPWPLPVSGTDSSGVCSLSVQAGAGEPIADPSLTGPNDSSWQECPQPASWTGAVDTREYVSGSGQLPVTLQATNAAVMTSSRKPNARKGPFFLIGTAMRFPQSSEFPGRSRSGQGTRRRLPAAPKVAAK